MKRNLSLGAVAWRSVMVAHDGYRSSCLLDGSRTLRCALDLARKASVTYPGVDVCVFTGKRVGKLTATFRDGVEVGSVSARAIVAEGGAA